MLGAVVCLMRDGFFAWLGALITVQVLFHWLRFSVGQQSPEPRGFTNAVVRIVEAIAAAAMARKEAVARSRSNSNADSPRHSGTG